MINSIYSKPSTFTYFLHFDSLVKVPDFYRALPAIFGILDAVLLKSSVSNGQIPDHAGSPLRIVRQLRNQTFSKNAWFMLLVDRRAILDYQKVVCIFSFELSLPM